MIFYDIGGWFSFYPENDKHIGGRTSFSCPGFVKQVSLVSFSILFGFGIAHISIPWWVCWRRLEAKGIGFHEGSQKIFGH